jgi:hypothetical protein
MASPDRELDLSAPPADAAMRALMMQRLRLLFHVEVCAAAPCAAPGCAAYTALWRHMNACDKALGSCARPLCSSSTYCLLHFTRCAERRCGVCAGAQPPDMDPAAVGCAAAAAALAAPTARAAAAVAAACVATAAARATAAAAAAVVAAEQRTELLKMVPMRLAKVAGCGCGCGGADSTPVRRAKRRSGYCADSDGEQAQPAAARRRLGDGAE